MEDYWVANAAFTGNTSGTYRITGTMKMTAGNSHISWIGEDSVDVTVIDEIEVVGFVAKNIRTETEINKQGKITGYNSTYDLYR